MKKAFLAMGLAALLSLPVASYAAEAPVHLYGNSNMVNVYEHMGSAVYLVKNSARMVAKDKDTGFIFKVDIKNVSYDPSADEFRTQSVSAKTPVWFYCPLNKNFHGYSAMFAGDKEIDVPPYVNTQVSSPASRRWYISSRSCLLNTSINLSSGEITVIETSTSLSTGTV